MKPHNAAKTNVTTLSKNLLTQTKPPFPTRIKTQICANQISESKRVATTDNNFKKGLSEDGSK